MSAANKPQPISTQELKEAYLRSNLKFRGWGFLKALQTASVCKSLELDAMAQRQKYARQAEEKAA